MATDARTTQTPELSRNTSFFTRKRLEEIFELLRDYNLKDDIYDKGPTKIGLGASSDVFRARSRRYDRLVAVKSIRVFLLEDMSFARALGNEMRLWVRLDHPNVLPLLGFYLDGPNANPNLVSEWMLNGTVTSYMRERPFDASEICNMIAGIASGLEYLHVEQNITHSDLKGSNILVSDDGRPLLADFGLATCTDSSSLVGTLGHGGKGSLRWMAKELHSPNNVVDHSTMTDMWSFGMVICELLTKNKPYPDTPDIRISTTILAGELPQQPDFSNLSDSEVFRALWCIALACWNEVPALRLSVTDVLGRVRLILSLLHGGISTSAANPIPQVLVPGSPTLVVPAFVGGSGSPSPASDIAPEVDLNGEKKWIAKYRQKISDVDAYPDDKLRKNIRTKRWQVNASAFGVGAGLALIPITVGISSAGAGVSAAALYMVQAKLSLLEAEWMRRGHRDAPL